MRYLLACLVLAGCSLGSARDTANTLDQYAPIVDGVVSALDPRLGRVEAGVDGFQDGLDQVAEIRAAEGIPETSSLRWQDWLVVVGTTLGGVFGYGARRNSTREKFKAELMGELEKRTARRV